MGNTKNINDLEKGKFFIDENGDVCVRVCDASTTIWDCITTTYPNSTTEVFEYYLGDPAVLQQTTTVIYTDDTKCEIVSVKKVSNV